MITIDQFIKGVNVVGRDISRLLHRELDFHRVRPNASLLFLTYRCNSRCKTCTAWKRDHNEEIKREIAFPGWKRIIDRLDEAGIKTTEIFGGNVLLRKDLLVELLKYLKLKKFITHLPTNQIGLDDETAETVVECADAVYISADGIGEHQDAIRGQKGAFERVDGAVAKLARFRKCPGKPRLVCNTTVSRFNVQDLEELVRYAISAGFDEIHFEYAGEFTQEHVDLSAIGGLKPTPYYLRENESILVDLDGARRIKETLRDIKEKYKNSRFNIVTVNIDVLSEKNLVEGTIPHDKCYVERNEVTVDPAGNVVICPFINNYRLGNLLEAPLEKIWNNDLHRKFREYQNRGRLEICRHCILGVQRNPGTVASLKRIYLSRIEPKIH